MSQFYVEQLVTAFLAIIICGVVCHAYMLAWSPSSLVTWKAVDYAWLFTSAVAIFLTIIANHQALANAEIAESKGYLAKMHKDLAGHLEMALMDQCLPIKKAPAETVSAECTRLRNLQKQYAAMKSGDKLIASFEEQPIKDNAFSKNFRNQAQAYETNRRKIAEDEVAAAPTISSSTLRFVAPIIFGGLLGLRLTKATADMVAEMGKSNPKWLTKDNRPVLCSSARHRHNKKLRRNEKAKHNAADCKTNAEKQEPE